MDSNLEPTEREMHKFRALLKAKHPSMGGTLKIHKTNGRVFCPALFMFVACFLLGEFIFRQQVVQNHLLGPRIGSRHRQFEAQWARLEKLVKGGEPIDCIFLGNSMVWIDVNPLIVSEAFRIRTGEEIHCFNFGVSALPASSAGMIAPILVERYHPNYLIYGTFARDYAIPLSSDDASAVSNTPWLKYESGQFDLDGWLHDHSSYYQYKDYVPDLLSFNFGEVFPGYKGFPPYHDYGFDPKMNVRIDVRKSPDPNDIGSKDPYQWLHHYVVLNENLEGLLRITGQSECGVKVIIIEMPFYPTAFEFFLNGKDDYNQYIRRVVEISGSSEAEVWRLEGQPGIPKEYWWDYFHMNINGARVFSEWLGNKLGEATFRSSEASGSMSKQSSLQSKSAAPECQTAR